MQILVLLSWTWWVDEWSSVDTADIGVLENAVLRMNGVEGEVQYLA